MWGAGSEDVLGVIMSMLEAKEILQIAACVSRVWYSVATAPALWHKLCVRDKLWIEDSEHAQITPDNWLLYYKESSTGWFLEPMDCRPQEKLQQNFVRVDDPAFCTYTSPELERGRTACLCTVSGYVSGMAWTTRTIPLHARRPIRFSALFYSGRGFWKVGVCHGDATEFDYHVPRQTVGYNTNGRVGGSGGAGAVTVDSFDKGDVIDVELENRTVRFYVNGIKKHEQELATGQVSPPTRFYWATDGVAAVVVVLTPAHAKWHLNYNRNSSIRHLWGKKETRSQCPFPECVALSKCDQLDYAAGDDTVGRASAYNWQPSQDVMLDDD